MHLATLHIDIGIQTQIHRDTNTETQGYKHRDTVMQIKRHSDTNTNLSLYSINALLDETNTYPDILYEVTQKGSPSNLNQDSANVPQSEDIPQYLILPIFDDVYPHHASVNY